MKQTRQKGVSLQKFRKSKKFTELPKITKVGGADSDRLGYLNAKNVLFVSLGQKKYFIKIKVNLPSSYNKP